MFLFVTVLLGLVFKYKVESKGVPFPNLRIPDRQDEPHVYYVRVNSTILVFIASWSSSLAPMLATFALSLISYSIAVQYLSAARAERSQALMTPYQLFLTLRFLEGSVFRALWSWIRYVVGWKKHRERQTSPLSATAFVAALAMLLGIVVFASDTWLHVTTKTVNYIQVSPVLSGMNYSFGLVPGCKTASNYSYETILRSEDPVVCSLNIGRTAVFLVNGSQSIQVLNNVSDSMIVLTYNSTQATYLGVPPSDELSQRDYTAMTYGMQTQCMLVSGACNLTAYDGTITRFDQRASNESVANIWQGANEYMSGGIGQANL